MSYKHLLAAAIVSALPATAIADTVFYCQMKEFADVGIDNVKRWKSQQFMMKVSQENITFSGDGYMDGDYGPPNHFYDNDMYWYAGNKWSVILFQDGLLSFSGIGLEPRVVKGFHAMCESFD